jgi:hypothetical protein
MSYGPALSKQVANYMCTVAAELSDRGVLETGKPQELHFLF